MKRTLKESSIFAARSLLMPCLVLCLQAGCASRPSMASDLHRLQGYWEGEGPPGKISITIKGHSLHFYARPDFWYETIFTLPAGTDPKQLHATIKDSSSTTKDAGEMVFAIFKIEDGTLTLAVDDGSDEPPATFPDASSRYHLKMAQPQEKNTKHPHFRGDYAIESEKLERPRRKKVRPRA